MLPGDGDEEESIISHLPLNIGTKDNSAGAVHVINIMMATTRFVILVGYFNGLTIA